jgi:hypothetical protein
MLADLETNGKIHLAFVYRGNSENTKAFLMEQDEILKDLASKGNKDSPIKESTNELNDNQSGVSGVE